jgi:Fe2+ or Zn2+ uptake regulation protein
MHVHNRKLIVAVSEPFDTIPLAHHREQRATLPGADIRRRLRDAELRPTRPRIVLEELLDRYSRHWGTAVALYSDVSRGQHQVSRATVTYTLRQLEQASELKRIVFPGSKMAWFPVERPITGRR